MSESNQHNATNRGQVAMISGDLMFASRVKMAAQNAGLEFCLGGTLPEACEHVRYVVLDLSTRSAIVAEVRAQCDDRCPNAELIAYGPHVQVDRLDAAREAGIQNVMTNGQFNNRLSSLFQPPD